MNRLGEIVMLVSFVVSALNIQGWLTLFLGETVGQLIAYLNLGLVVLGIFVFITRQEKPLPYLIKLWMWFLGLYLTFGLLGNIIHDTEVGIKVLIPFIFFLGFSFFFNVSQYHKKSSIIVTIVFVISCLLLIILQRLNFSLDSKGVYSFNLERAAGVYADANNASLVCILAFVFVQHVFKPVSKFQKVLKLIISVIVLYAVVLTFSKTGFIVLLVVLGLTYHKWFNPKRIILTLIIIPILLLFTINLIRNSDSLSVIQKERVESVLNILSLQTNQVKTSERDVLLRNMMNYVYENPLIGNGHNFSVIVRGHNSVLGVWADAGIFVFLFFLFLLFQHFRKSMLAPVENRYFSLSILFILTLFMLSLQTVINQPYLVVIFVWVAYLVSNQKSEIKIDSNKL